MLPKSNLDGLKTFVFFTYSFAFNISMLGVIPGVLGNTHSDQAHEGTNPDPPPDPKTDMNGHIK